MTPEERAREIVDACLTGAGFESLVKLAAQALREHGNEKLEKAGIIFDEDVKHSKPAIEKCEELGELGAAYILVNRVLVVEELAEIVRALKDTTDTNRIEERRI